MHCVSYPMETADANLIIDELKKMYGCNVGYSGHENGVVSLSALQFNISSLERHITLDRSMYGSDQSTSLEPKGMKSLTEVDKFILAIGEPSVGKF